MKRNKHIIVVPFFAFFALLSCSKQQPLPTPAPSPTPSPSPLLPPPATPEPTPTPFVELSDDGFTIVYSKKYFSITRTDGIRGYPPGTRFALLDDLGQQLLLRDMNGESLQVEDSKVERSFKAATNLKQADRERQNKIIKLRASQSARVAEQEREQRKEMSRRAAIVTRQTPTPLPKPKPTATPKGPYCAIKHYGTYYHRRQNGTLIRCPANIAK